MCTTKIDSLWEENDKQNFWCISLRFWVIKSIFFYKGICGRLLSVLVCYLPPVAGRYLNDRPADVYALSFNWRLYITSYLDFALLKISRVWRASISNKDLNIEPIPFLFSDSTANVFPEFIFGCLCNKNANTPAHKGISFSRR